MQEFDHEKLDVFGVASDFVIAADEITSGAVDGKGTATAAIAMLDDRSTGNSPTTLGADKGYDTKHARRRSSIDGRTTRHPGHGVSQGAAR